MARNLLQIAIDLEGMPDSHQVIVSLREIKHWAGEMSALELENLNLSQDVAELEIELGSRNHQ